MDERPRVVVIGGPTASGKTSLGVDLALALKGEVVNADSMQVYIGMDVGTAKPGIEERKGIPHHLLDVVEPDQEFNAAVFRSMALPLAREIYLKGRSCFVVGGTGLYIKSLLSGLFEIPSVNPDLRSSLLRECEEGGLGALHGRLNDLDPESAAKIHPKDRVRITRALEIIQLTGRRFSDLSREHGFRDSPFRSLKLCLDVEREELYRRINERTLAMIEAGLARETEELLRKGYSPDLKPMKAIGYRHMVQHLEGKCSLEEAVETLQRDTRRYAKRQLTWFRSDPEVKWIRPADFDLALEMARSFLSETP
jgi:tRNA dimethylallyltransferase